MSGNGLTYVLPSVAYLNNDKLIVKFRLKNKVTKSFIVAKSNGIVLAKKYLLAGVPGEMQTMEIDKTNAKGDIIVEVEN